MHDKVVSELMNASVISCPLDMPIPDVARLMTQNDVSAVVVVDEDECLAGLISRTDLVTLYGFEEMWPHLRAGQVMSTALHTVGPDERAVIAAQQLHQHKVSRLIVTEAVEEKQKQRPIGVLSITDIVRQMSMS